MDEIFFVVSIMAVSFNVYKTNDKNKFFCKYFLVLKLTDTKIFFSRFSISKEFIYLFIFTIVIQWGLIKIQVWFGNLYLSNKSEKCHNIFSKIKEIDLYLIIIVAGSM